MADVDFWQTNLLLEVLTGSRAQGLAGPDSDTDSRGVCIPPREVLLGLEAFEQHEERGGDRVVYSLSKLVRLALDGNPNIIEMLYVEPEDVLFRHRFGERLLAERGAFLTRRVGERFLRYAGHQLRRMERHRRWLLSPPTREPEPADHGAMRAGGRWRFPDTDSEKAYRAAHKHWEHFRAWRRDRNAARAELEARHGYDTKHAMHLCRLLRMGTEILEEGVVRVRRPDAEWLRSVRRGAFAYEELLDQANAQLARLPALRSGSPLPEEPDRGRACALVVSLHEEYLAKGMAT